MTTFFSCFFINDWRRVDPNNTKSGPSSSNQRNTRGPILSDIECQLGNFVIYRGIQTPCPTRSGSAHVLCKVLEFCEMKFYCRINDSMACWVLLLISH